MEGSAHLSYASMYESPGLDTSFEPSSSFTPQRLVQSEQHYVPFQADCVMNRCPEVGRDTLGSSIGKHVVTYRNSAVDLALSSLPESSLGKGRSEKRDYLTNTMGKSREQGQSSVREFTFDRGIEWHPPSKFEEYSTLALDHLKADFRWISEDYIKKTFLGHDSLYGPTHLFLLGQENQENNQTLSHVTLVPYKHEATSLPKNKGKGRELSGVDFYRERERLLEEILERNNGVKFFDEVPQNSLTGIRPMFNEEMVPIKREEVECECCFSMFALSHMLSCTDKHLFCHACVASHSTSLILLDKVDIGCPSIAGCQAFFPDSELGRCLPEKLLDIRRRLLDRRQILEAGLPLGECPFCGWICVVVDEQAPELVCGNIDACGVKSCRKCKQSSHLPKTCKEIQESKKQEGRHAVEEAMTSALVRRCPQCTKPFIKEDGCNKMTCPFCGTVSCYVCRQTVKDGYDHFERNTRRTAGSSSQTRKCLLMDSVEERHATEVIEAATRALEALDPDVKQDIQVNLPVMPPPRRFREVLVQRVQHVPMIPRQPTQFAVFQNPQLRSRPQPMVQPRLAHQPGQPRLQQPNIHLAPHINGHVNGHVNEHVHAHVNAPINTYIHAPRTAAPVAQAPLFVFGQGQQTAFTAPLSMQSNNPPLRHTDAPQVPRSHMNPLHVQTPQHVQTESHQTQTLHNQQNHLGPFNGNAPQHIYPESYPVHVPPPHIHGAPHQGRQYLHHTQPNVVHQTNSINPTEFSSQPPTVDHSHLPFNYENQPPLLPPAYPNNPPMTRVPQQLAQGWVEYRIQPPNTYFPAHVHTHRAIQQVKVAGEHESYFPGLQNPPQF